MHGGTDHFHKFCKCCNLCISICGILDKMQFTGYVCVFLCMLFFLSECTTAMPCVSNCVAIDFEDVSGMVLTGGATVSFSSGCVRTSLLVPKWDLCKFPRRFNSNTTKVCIYFLDVHDVGLVKSSHTCTP